MPRTDESLALCHPYLKQSCSVHPRHPACAQQNGGELPDLRRSVGIILRFVLVEVLCEVEAVFTHDSITKKKKEEEEEEEEGAVFIRDGNKWGSAQRASGATPTRSSHRCDECVASVHA